MAIFFHKKGKGGKCPPYDPETQRPALRRSICTGEMTAGFIDINRDGAAAAPAFHELRLLRDRKELDAFCREVGVPREELTVIY